MSQEPCGPVATPKVAKSPKKPKRKKLRASRVSAVKQGNKRKHMEVRLFEPELEVPFRLAMFTKGRGKKVSAPLWLQAGVKSGLVAMGSPTEDSLKHGLFKSLKKRNHPLEGMKPGDLDALLLKGTIDALERIRKNDAK